MPDVRLFDIAGVTKRARIEGRRAGRSHGLGRPIAETPEQLPSRRWIKARFDEFIGEAERRLVAARREHNAQAEAYRERLREVARERDRHRARIADLAPAHEADRTKPRHQQDLALEYDLGDAHEQLQAAIAREHELTLSLSGVGEQLEEIDREFTAWPTRLREACDTAEQEHDIAYRRAQHAWYVNITRRLRRAPGANLLIGRADA